MSDTRTELVAPVGGRRLWTGLWLAPLAWAVAGLAGYVLVARSCEGPNGVHWRGMANPSLGAAALAALLLVAAVGALFLSYRNWRVMETSQAPNDARVEREAGAVEPGPHGVSPAWGRAQFISFAGLLASSLFILGIVYFVVPAFLVNPCVQSH